MSLISTIQTAKDPLSLLDKYAPQLTEIGDLTVNVLLEESDNESYEISDTPIQGSWVTNHVVKNPRTVTLIGILADNTFNPTGILQQVRATGKPSFETALDKLKHLQEMHRTKTIIDIDTVNDFYNVFLIRECRVIRTLERSKAVFFTLTARHVEFVYSTIVGFDPSTLPKEKVKKLQKTKHKNVNDKTAAAKDKGIVEPKPIEKTESLGVKFGKMVGFLE